MGSQKSASRTSWSSLGVWESSRSHRLRQISADISEHTLLIVVGTGLVGSTRVHPCPRGIQALMGLPHSWPDPQVRAMQRPPPGVKLVIEAVCIMKGIKPKKVPGEKPGSKVDDYWEPGKGLLQDPGRFLDSLFKFDKVSMPGAGWPVGKAGKQGEELALPQCRVLCPVSLCLQPHSPVATGATGRLLSP